VSKVPTHLWTLMCDDIREEKFNKYSLMGLYGPDLILRGLPGALPKLAFFVIAKGGQGPQKFTCSLVDPDGVQMVGAMGEFNIPDDAGEDQQGTVPIVFGPVVFRKAGPYRFEVHLEGQEGPFSFLVFNVASNPNVFA